MEDSNAIKIIESFMAKDKECMPLRYITIEEAIQKLKGAVPNINLKKICGLIAQGKLKPLIRYEGILVEYYFYTWELQAALSGNYSHDDIDDFSPATVGVTSRVFKGFLAPQNKDLFAKLLTQKKPEECIKFNIFMTEKSLLNVDEEGLSNEMQLLSRIDGVADLSHVQLNGNTEYGYIDDDGAVELEFSDFVFLEKQVINLLDEFRLLKNTKENKIIEHSRQDEVSPIIEKLVEEFPEDSTNSIWLKLVELAKNKQYGLEGYNEVMQEIIYHGGPQAEARYKLLGQEALRARIRRLKKKRTFKDV